MTDARRRFVLALAAVVAVAVALRSWPLLHSPLPFNPDGIVHADHAAAVEPTGHLPLAELATDDLLFTAFLATLAEVTGVSAMRIAQPVIAVVGAAPVLVAATVARRVTRRVGWDRSRAAFAGALAAGLLAVEGVYLHRSMAVDEQTLGLLFVPLVVLAVAVAVRTGSRRWVAVGATLLVALPATHNLDALVAALALTGLAALAVTTGRRAVAGRALVFATAAWAALVGYTFVTAWLTPALVRQSERIAGVPGLFLAWILLLAVGLPWLVRARPRTQRALGAGTFAAVFAVVGVNAVIPVFPGTPRTPPLLVAAALPLFALAVVACWAVPTAKVGPEGRALGALVGAVVALVGLALTASLTPDYENLAYRAQTFVHLPVLVAAGIGVVGVVTRRSRPSSRRVTAVVTALALVAAAASIPVAYGGLAVVPYKGVTTHAEYETSRFAVERVPGSWAADNHVARITWGHEDVVRAPGSGAAVAPTYEWIVANGPPPNCPTVVQQSWSTVGAQFFPRPPATLSAGARQGFARRNHVVYGTAGTADSLELVVPRSAGDCA